MYKKYQRTTVTTIAGVLSAAVLSLPCTARAQSTSDQAENRKGAIEEIIVTARRREESLEKTPISITAFSSSSIEKNMFKGITDYFSRTPNVSYITQGSRDRQELSIRGVTNQLDTTEALVRAGTFGFYIDDVNVAGATSNPVVMDLERIEVLRGPQGTYFGRNAIGGAINITTKKPENETYTEVQTEISRYQTYDAQGIMNIPLINNVLAVRADLKYRESNGYIKNINPTGGGNDSTYKYGRISFRYTPNEALTVDVSATFSDEVVGMREGVPSGVLSVFAAGLYGPVADPDGVGFWPNNRNKVNFNRPQSVGSKWQLYAGKITYDFGNNITLTSISGYVNSSTFLHGDIDGSSRDLFYETKPISRDSISQEFRLQSEGNETFDWTFGAIYSRDKGNIAQHTYVGDAMPFGLPSGFEVTASYAKNKTTSEAVFGEGVWHATSALDLIAGFRYTHDKVEVAQYNLSSGVVNNQVSDSSSFNDVSPKVSARYTLSDATMVFATISKGYKSGGVQIGSTLDNQSFDPEKLWNYEVGFKSKLFNDRATLNASVFYLDWKDLQASFAVATNDNGNIVFQEGIQNAASADSKGAEVELSALLTDNLIFHFGAGYVDAKFKDFTNAYVDGNIVDLSGRNMPNAPKWTLNADAEYDFPVRGSFNGFARLEWYYRDELQPDLVGLTRVDEGFPFTTPSYNHVNLRVGIEGPKFSIVGYVENLFNDHYYTNYYQKAFVGGLYLEPSYQTYGVRVTFRSK